MNNQTPGPLWLDDDGCIAAGSADTYITVAAVHGPNRQDLLVAKEANRRLLAASFNAFDRAGRELCVDATELAQSIDLEKLIWFHNTIEKLVNMLGHDSPVSLLSGIRNAIEDTTGAAGVAKREK